MRYAARIATAIELLTAIDETQRAADRSLEHWARQNRYAGAKDRRFIQELVYSVLRHRRYLAWVMDDPSWRSCVIAAAIKGYLPEASSASAAHALSLDSLFDGSQYGPAPLSDDERQRAQQGIVRKTDDPMIVHSIPDWAENHFLERFGSCAVDEMAALNRRAPVDLRVNQSKTDLAGAQKSLAEDGIDAHAIDPAIDPAIGHSLALTCATSASGQLRASRAFKEGWVEVQDRGAQMITRLVCRPEDRIVLDYCAGAGGKALHLADLLGAQADIFVHDVSEQRLTGLWPRQKRASAHHIKPAMGEGLTSLTARADLVIVDAPCSGSGRWRRNPETKWQFSSQRLEDVTQQQADVLVEAARYVRPGARLAYMTCSLFRAENRAQIEKFLTENPQFEEANLNFEQEKIPAFASSGASTCIHDYELSPHATGSDGFYVAVMRRRA